MHQEYVSRIDSNLYIGKAPISENTDAYENGMWRPTPQLIRTQKGVASSYYDKYKRILDQIFGSRQNWETIIAEFTEYCTQLTQGGIFKSHSEALAHQRNL